MPTLKLSAESDQQWNAPDQVRNYSKSDLRPRESVTAENRTQHQLPWNIESDIAGDLLSRIMVRFKDDFVQQFGDDFQKEMKTHREITQITLEKELDELRSALNDAKCRNSVLENQLQDLNQSAREKELDLKSALDYATDQRSVLNSQLHELEDAAKTLHDKYEKTEQDSQRKSVAIEDLNREVEDLHSRIYESIQRCKHCSVLSQNNAELKEENHARSTENEAVLKTVRQLERVCSEQAQKFDVVLRIKQQKIENLHVSMIKSWKMYTTEAAALTDQKEKCEQLCKERQEQKDAQDMTIYRLTKTAMRQQLINQALRSELAAWRNRVLTNQDRFMTLEDELRLADSEKQCNALEIEREETKTLLNNVIATNNELWDRNDIVETNLLEANSSRAQLLDHIETLKARDDAGSKQENLIQLVLEDVEKISSTLAARLVSDQETRGMLQALTEKVSEQDDREEDESRSGQIPKARKQRHIGFKRAFSKEK